MSVDVNAVVVRPKLAGMENSALRIHG
jgi:hypothetical protein